MMEYTNEESVYSNKLLSPFKADPGKFISCYRNQLNYYNQIDLSRYKQIIEVYYEQLINDPDYLFGLLGIKEKTDYTLVNKSTNNYYNLFTNIAQLKLIADNYHDDMKICNSCPNLIGCRPSECVEKK
jgi:hypothetical protein